MLTEKIKVIGCGGIATYLFDALCRYLNHSDIENVEVTLIDGDKYEAKNAKRQKFDADGAYVRRWVPELAGLPAEYLHCPWEAPSSVLAAAKVSRRRLSSRNCRANCWQPTVIAASR